MEGTGVQADPTTYANVPESINQTRIRDLYRQDSPSLGGARFGSPEQKAFGSGRMFPANVGFTSPSAPTVDQTSPSMVTQDFPPLGGTGVSPETVRSRRFDEPDPGAIVGPIQTFQNIIDPIDPLQTVYQRGFTPGEDVGMLYGRGFDPTPSGALTQVTLPAARPSVIDTQPKTDANAAAAKLAALARSGGAKTKEELNLVQRFGRFLQGLGKGISNFQMSDIFEFLKGDPNYKGPSPAQQQLMGVPGPGPAVGGGAPSPSGGGGGGGMPMPAKDPCPPGFRFDPTLQQCVPIIAPNTPTDTTTTPTTPTTPAPGTTPPAAGGIADAYPFVLTPPIGTPVGNLPPVRLTT
jgi:hypothetical protein